MKKIFTLIAMCTIALASNAQIVSSRSRSITTEQQEFPNYNRIYVAYTPMSFSGDRDYKPDMWDTAPGLTLGWTGGWSISKSVPLYVEGGLNIKWNHMSESEGDYYGREDKCKCNFLSLNVPVNLSYKINIPQVEGLSIAPYAGVHLTGNLLGKGKYESHKDWEENFNLFDEDDVEYTAKRIQFGWQAGVGFNYKAIYLGVGYSGEFTNYMKKVRTGGLVVSLGFNF